MSAVLVGMFDTKMAAEEARSKLVSAGFQPSAVRTSNDPDADPASSSDSSRNGSTDEGGGFMGWLHGLFGSDDADVDRTQHVERYKEAFRRGAFGLDVATSSDADTDRACDVLNAAGAIDIDERSRTEGWADAATGMTGTAQTAAMTGMPDKAKPTAAGATDMKPGTTQTLKLVEEDLAVGKRSVARGGVRVLSRVVEVPVEQSVTLREEHTNVERRVVDRPATEADFAAFKAGTIEVRDMAEEAVVGKTARVVGEVEIGQQVTERDETVRDTVRKTEVNVEQLPVGTSTTAVPKTAPKL